MRELEYGQICFSTAEDESNYFCGQETTGAGTPAQENAMPAGLYRVIDGQLTKIVSYRSGEALIQFTEPEPPKK